MDAAIKTASTSAPDNAEMSLSQIIYGEMRDWAAYHGTVRPYSHLSGIRYFHITCREHLIHDGYMYEEAMVALRLVDNGIRDVSGFIAWVDDFQILEACINDAGGAEATDHFYEWLDEYIAGKDLQTGPSDVISWTMLTLKKYERTLRLIQNTRDERRRSA